MSYKVALEAAGAKVLQFKNFGDWSGSWYSLVEYNGTKGWVRGSFGSCSYSDSFEAEFGNYWDEEENPEEYNKRLDAFGRRYLDNMLTQEEAEAEASKDIDWDLDAEVALKFIKKNA